MEFAKVLNKSFLHLVLEAGGGMGGKLPRGKGFSLHNLFRNKKVFISSRRQTWLYLRNRETSKF